MAEDNNVNGKDFVIGTLVGGIIGASAALLLAPKSGRDLRVDLSDGYQSASKRTKEIAKNVGEQTEAVVERAREVADHVKEDVQKWRDNVTDENEDEVTETTGEANEEAAATVDEGSQEKQ